ncbi:MAG TPA: NAD-dependent epimerase/dehydratase family protein [Bryobacteraceae bacterium]|jgi:nucleoside-diphosphate-sugar epimerase
MKVLLIGATGFIGPHVVRELAKQGHEVTVFHRGGAEVALPYGVKQLYGDRNDIENSLHDFRSTAPDVVVDFILSSERQAAALMNTFRGIAHRIVALSSGDVYRACGILHGSESGPLQPVPLTEDSQLRANRNPYGSQMLTQLRAVFGWLDDEYDKIPVEHAVMSNPELPGTVLRLPMVYGPGDPLHRLFPYLKRMDDGREAILIQENAARWRGPRGYVDNVAAAIALATVSSRASGRIYNIAEEPALSEAEWVQRIGRSARWDGSVVPLSKDLTPVHLRVSYNHAQDWIMSSVRIREELGYVELVGSDEAIERTIAWERANPPVVAADAFDYAAEDKALEARRFAT